MLKEITKINQFEAERVITSRKPIGKFLVTQDGCFTGIDNSTGDAWTEDFNDRDGCIGWLRGDEHES